MKSILAVALSLVALTSASDAPAARSEPNVPLVVPHFAADDERVGTAGFVRFTTRESVEREGTTYTLMIFAVGDVLTLGAMIEGTFEGAAHWEVGDRSFSVPMRRSDRGSDEIAATGAALVGQHGGFDAFDWVNVEVPLDAWLAEGTSIRLRYSGETVEVALPGGSEWFEASIEER